MYTHLWVWALIRLCVTVNEGACLCHGAAGTPPVVLVQAHHSQCVLVKYCAVQDTRQGSTSTLLTTYIRACVMQQLAIYCWPCEVPSKFAVVHRHTCARQDKARHRSDVTRYSKHTQCVFTAWRLPATAAGALTVSAGSNAARATMADDEETPKPVRVAAMAVVDAA
jgi:hypothetical protein